MNFDNIKFKLYYLPIYISLLFFPTIIGFFFASNGEISDFLSLIAIKVFYVTIFIILINFIFSKKNAITFHKDLFINIIVMGISSLILLGILEGFARVIADDEKLAYQRLGGTEYRKTVPLPLQNSDYDVAWFMQNYDSVEVSIIDYPNIENAKYIEAPQNPYFTIKNNRRYTTNAPQVDNFDHNKLYIFGGSTVFCREVIDSLTLPSYLQRLILEKYPSMEVVNCGISGISTSTQLANLQLIQDSLKKDDIVIFYDGVNNSLSGIGKLESESYKKTEISSFFISTLSFLHSFRERLYILLHKKSTLINWLLYPYTPQKPIFISQNLVEDENFKKGIDSIANNYVKDIENASIICKKKEVNFFHFLRPQLASRHPNTNFEKELIANPYIRIGYDVEYFKICYPIFREKLEGLKATQNLSTYDISSIFNDITDEVFIDNCHLSQEGNKIVAQNINKYIK